MNAGVDSVYWGQPCDQQDAFAVKQMQLLMACYTQLASDSAGVTSRHLEGTASPPPLSAMMVTPAPNMPPRREAAVSWAFSN